ncbi:alpha/beta fold hydrolase [Xinfangfangia sp. CPCC 101601]|uniref:Alpha/beta fold hydrolase n=1 Tax=Pseudogemmobacter lacusdianii TaxID=3069608 RepID=A0ABU0W047_9RHOB|nr:alpha/beta fold hydrolase [Xinfangfangia sp. CPCC 101601]MDQ2067371.1 alpha/beta fold hydrolase [Xinfangfangia sp. CPCC 101601]
MRKARSDNSASVSPEAKSRMNAPSEQVLLVHGLARSPRSLLAMELALRAAGFSVVNMGYPSTKAPPQELVEGLIAGLERAAEGGSAEGGAGRVTHIVTHSMGGILVRDWLSRRQPAGLGRVVMLAPPNHGSELVDAMGSWRAFQVMNGPAGMALGTGPESWPNRLPAANFPLGVIAGTTTVSPWFSYILPGANDGKVTVASTKVAGMADHITLPVSHTWMVMNPQVVRQTVHFLRNGRFWRGK